MQQIILNHYFTCKMDWRLCVVTSKSRFTRQHRFHAVMQYCNHIYSWFLLELPTNISQYSSITWFIFSLSVSDFSFENWRNRRRSVNILTDRNNDITMSQLNLKSNSVVRHWRICTSELSSEDFLFRTYDFASLQMSKYNADFSKN